MKPADLLIVIGGDDGCPLVIVPLRRPLERISKYRRSMPLFRCLVRGFPNYRSLQEE
jgi:hypothetical protein